MSEHSPTSRLRFREYILTGILTLIPVSVTFLVIKFLYDFLASIGQPLVSELATHLGTDWPQITLLLQNPIIQTLAFLLALLAALYLLGLFTTHVIGLRLIALMDAIMARIPFIETVYGSTKKFVDMLRTKPAGNLRRVVLVSFPTERMKAIGFVTRTMRDTHNNRELAVVYVPTAPNPTSGYMEIVPVEDIVPTDWTMDEAMSYIFSGGAVAPEKVTFSNPHDKN